MADEIDQVDSAYWKSLIRIPDTYLRGPDKEDNGKAYRAVLTELQIRPEVHEAFFNGNVRVFRNKKDNSALIAKSDDESLLKLSKLYLSAYGKIVWGIKRDWLFAADQLSDNETPLRYIMPKDRHDGDHDRLHDLLAKFWRQMRGIIFELKASLRRNHGYADLARANSQSRDLYRPRTSSPLAGASLTMPTRRGTEYHRESQSPEPDVAQQQQTAPNQENQENRFRRPYFYEPEVQNEVSIAGYWNASRTEKVILDAITELKWAQRESHPTVFITLWERHVARLAELEQYEEQQVTTSTNQDDTSTTQTEPVTDAGNAGEDDIDDTTTITNTTTGVNPEQSEDEEGVAMTDDTTTESIQPSPSPIPTSSNLNVNISHADQHRVLIPPSFPLTAYIPPTLPAVMTAYITPLIHSNAAAGYAQPYIWPDAPVHTTSYNAFRNGIRIRANVPDSVTDEKMALVLGYGWNDFCSVIRGENSWKNGFQMDLRKAAEKGGVGVWRMRVCVVVT